MYFSLVFIGLFQKQEKYSVNKLKALHARNEYLINIEVANAAINKYFSDDVSDLMDVSIVFIKCSIYFTFKVPITSALITFWFFFFRENKLNIHVNCLFLQVIHMKCQALFFSWMIILK